MATILQVNNTEIVEKKVDVEQALSRMQRPIDQLEVNVEVYGIYALPDHWKQKIDDPSEQLYQYELEVFGATLKHLKVCPRELTEEEKAEIEAAKNVKGKQPPPKADPKKKEEEPSKEELERIEKLKKEKEEKERKAREEWEALDEQTKFYVKNEDIYKEPCIKFNNVYAHKRIEQLKEQLSQTPESEVEQRQEIQAQIADFEKRLLQGHIIVEKRGYELVEFEEYVNQDKGCWIKFNKLPPPEEEITDPKAAAAKKAPPKGGKGAVVEDLKPFYGKAWINLEELSQPGAIEIKQRVPVQTCPHLIKQVGADGVEKWVHSDEHDNTFEQNQTYIYLKITLTEPVVPVVPEEPQPLPHDVVPVKQFIRWPFSKDPTDDFKKQITLAVESLAKEYYTMFQNELEQEAKGGKGESEMSESFEERKKEFLYEINTSGKYHILKEKLKKTIVRIVKEHFKKTGSIKGLYKDERDHFYSQLYAYLVQQMRVTVQQMVQKKRNELHENITVPQDQFLKERDNLIEEQSRETLAQRYLRLAFEYENLYNNINEAESFMQKYIALYEGDPLKMQEMGKFYLRINKLEKADEYLRDAYSFQIKNQEVAMNYACYLLQLGTRNKEAIVILNKLAQDQYEQLKAYLLISIAYEQDGDTIMASKFKSFAFLRRLRDLQQVPEAGEQRYNEPRSLPPYKVQPGQLQLQQQQDLEQMQKSNRTEGTHAFGNKRLNKDQEDEIYLDLADILQRENLCHLAHRVIENVHNLENIRYQVCIGSILMQKRNYKEAIQILSKIIEKNAIDVDVMIKLAHCNYFLKRYQDAENIYIKTIRICNVSENEIYDETVSQRLGYIFILQKQYQEAANVFTQCVLKYNNSSFSHFYLGVSLFETKKSLTHTASSLSRANALNPYKPEIWAYCVILDLYCGEQISSFQSLKETMKLKLLDKELLIKLAQALNEYGKPEEAKECMEIANRPVKDGARNKKF